MSRKRLLCSSFTAAPPAAVFAHRIKDSLSLPTFKRKQLRHELYPSQPHPPLGTGFLPLSRTDTFFSFFFFLSRVGTHLFRAPLSPPQLPPQQLFLSLYFPFLSPTFIHRSLALHADLVSSFCHAQALHNC